MNDSLTIVVDVGKTHAKLSLWDRHGGLVDQWSRANERQCTAGYRALDVDGIDRWLIETLAVCAGRGHIAAIVPVAHGAAAAILRAGRLWVPPMDYEEPVPDDDRDEYAVQRDPFAATGSPFLSGGLNLGMQLHRIESLHGPLPEDASILPWPQYWAWRLCGVMASEVTSLGCHSDLWRPLTGGFSDLAVARGWAERFAPRRQAGEVLGTITAAVANATGLPPDCQVRCGLHDSNAALLGCRGHAEIAERDATVLSTGTWFVAMRLPGPVDRVDTPDLSEDRDCLINVDIAGHPVPSARFMGGRESELIRGAGPAPAAASATPESPRDRLDALIERHAAALPAFVPGVGPFPTGAGQLVNVGDDARDRHLVASLYLASMSVTLLDLIGSSSRLLVEGRFADDPAFARALATMLPELSVLTGDAQSNLAYGALRLVDPTLPPPSVLTAVEPFDLDLAAYHADWRQRAADAVGAEPAAHEELASGAGR